MRGPSRVFLASTATPSHSYELLTTWLSSMLANSSSDIVHITIIIIIIIF